MSFQAEFVDPEIVDTEIVEIEFRAAGKPGAD